jgi:hypothetical protein
MESDELRELLIDALESRTASRSELERLSLPEPQAEAITYFGSARPPDLIT